MYLCKRSLILVSVRLRFWFFPKLEFLHEKEINFGSEAPISYYQIVLQKAAVNLLCQHPLKACLFSQIFYKIELSHIY